MMTDDIGEMDTSTVSSVVSQHITMQFALQTNVKVVVSQSS